MHLILYTFSILCIIFSSFLISVHCQSSGGSCTTPTRETGQCIPLKSCLPIYDVLQKSPRPLPSKLVDYLKRSHCAFQNNEHHICCANRHIMSTTRPTQPSIVMVDNNNEVNSFDNELILRHPSLKLLSLDRCGRSSNDRISYGNVTNLGEYPWMALLQYNTGDGLKFQCGGALISSRYVLTAAHCVTGIRSQIVSVRLGEHDVSKERDCELFEGEEYCLQPVQNIGIEEVRSHPKYNNPRFANDVAVIRLRRDAVFNENVQPICLPLTTELQSKSLDQVIISGWGLTERGSQSNELLKANINILDNQRCQQVLKRSIVLSSSQMCAIGMNGVDSCRGDSGGPLFFTGNFTFGRIRLRYVQYGIVSAGGIDCGSRTNLPGVYAKVSSYLKWILDQMRS